MFSKLVGFFKQATTPLSSNKNNSQIGSQNPIPSNIKEIKNNDNDFNKSSKENQNPNKLNFAQIYNQFEDTSPIYLNSSKNLI
jgi:hypothetical protein